MNPLNEGEFMVVTIFSVISILIVMLFFLNKLRITNFPMHYFSTCIKWYFVSLMVYFVLSSNQYYLRGVSRTFNDGLNLAVLTIISFGMIIYIHDYCEEKQRQLKLEELRMACALMEEELNKEKMNLK